MNITRNPLLLIFLGTAFLIQSCGDSNKIEESKEVVYTLVEQPNKEFELDYETAFDQIDGKYVEIDGTAYYTFFNRKNSSIYFYDYETGELYHQTKMAKDGPDAVEYPYYFFDYYVHDFDNIFINTMAFYYRINKDGEVLKRIKPDDTSGFFSRKNIAIDGAMEYRDGKLYCGISQSVPAEGDTSWLRTVYNFESETFEKEYVDERFLVPNYEEKARRLREMAKTGGISSVSTFFAGNAEEVYGSSAINDSLYHFVGSEFRGAYYAGDPEVEVTNLEGYFNKTKIETFEGGGISIGPKAIQPAFYTEMLSSPDNRYIYRILIHGTKPKVEEGSDKERPEVFGATLTIFDTVTKTSGKISLPVEELGINHYSTDVFVSRNGIHFPNKNIESESLKSYKLYRISSSETDLGRSVF